MLIPYAKMTDEKFMMQMPSEDVDVVDTVPASIVIYHCAKGGKERLQKMYPNSNITIFAMHWSSGSLKLNEMFIAKGLSYRCKTCNIYVNDNLRACGEKVFFAIPQAFTGKGSTYGKLVEIAKTTPDKQRELLAHKKHHFLSSPEPCIDPCKTPPLVFGDESLSEVKKYD